MRIIAGPPVKGDDFMFREREVALARQSLIDGTSLLIKGWRRIGKSSLLVETARRLADEKNVTPIYLDVQEQKTLSEFFSELMRSLPQNETQRLKTLWGGAKRLPGRLLDGIQRRLKKGSIGAGGVEAGVEFNQDIRDYWEPLKESVAALAKEHIEKGDRIVLLIDELPFFLQNLHRETGDTNEIRMVLAALRTWRNAGLAMAIAGSVSIEAFLEELAIEGLVINDLVRVDLKPLTRAEAETLVAELAKIAKLDKWNEVATNAVLGELPDHYPFFIQSAMNFIRADGRSDPDAIAEVFENSVHPQIFASFYQQFDERLEVRFPGDLRIAAEAALNGMAKSGPDGLTVADIDNIAKDKKVDGLVLRRRLELAEFIRQDIKTSRYRLVQNLLRKWRAARGGA